MAFAAPPLSTGRGRRGDVTGADPPASSGGGFLRPFFLARLSMRSTNDRADNDRAGSAWYLSQTAATTMAATPATMPGCPNDSPREWTMANEAKTNGVHDRTGDVDFDVMGVSTNRNMAGSVPGDKSTVVDRPTPWLSGRPLPAPSSAAHPSRRAAVPARPTWRRRVRIVPRRGCWIPRGRRRGCRVRPSRPRGCG